MHFIYRPTLNRYKLPNLVKKCIHKKTSLQHLKRLACNMYFHSSRTALSEFRFQFSDIRTVLLNSEHQTCSGGNFVFRAACPRVDQHRHFLRRFRRHRFRGKFQCRHGRCRPRRSNVGYVYYDHDWKDTEHRTPDGVYQGSRFRASLFKTTTTTSHYRENDFFSST